MSSSSQKRLREGISMTYELNLLNKLSSSEIAVIDHEKRWTYQEFAQHVFSLKRFLCEKHIERVAFRLTQGFRAYVIEWASYLAGTAFCPIDPTDPLPRTQHILNTFLPNLVIADRCESELRGKYGAVTYDDIIDLMEPASIDTNPSNSVSGGIAYVIFTSGTTGMPKGVIIKRKALENFLDWSTREFNVTPSDKWAQYSSIGFDLSICDIFTAVLGGASLVSFSNPSDKLLPGPRIREHQITVWHSVPTIIDLLSKANQLTHEYLGSLRLMSFCGEKMFPSQLKSLFPANPNVLVLNTYGPTEGTVFCTFQELRAEDYTQYCDSSVSIGSPIPGYELIISDQENNKGELVLKSEFVAAGYLDSGGDGPVGGFGTIRDADSEHEIYATGDYVHRDENGNLYFDARRDSQVKILGNRVDLNEIDFHLRNLGCTQVKTVYFDKRIVSFVVNDRRSPESLLKELGQLVPKSCIPRQLLVYDSLPLNRNGKVNTNMLIKDIHKLHSGDMQNDIATLRELIAEALNCNVDTITLDSGLGGHYKWDSLGHVSIMALLESRYGITLDASNVTKTKSIKDILLLLREMESRESTL
jgi:D-alanine--poly(phosphoribitol) ligase subunit 1